MASIPLDLQRRFEQRWPPDSSSDRIRTRPKRKSSKRRFNSRPQPAKANEELAGLGRRVSSLHQRCERVKPTKSCTQQKGGEHD